MLFFFFSSRRRHTRLQGDWSSDVCSSDLDERIAHLLLGTQGVTASRPLTLGEHGNRSEERRVGKECRSRWSRYQKKKKTRKVEARAISASTRFEPINQAQPVTSTRSRIFAPIHG